MSGFARSMQYIESDMATVTIANAASTSEALHLGGLAIFGVVMPAAWTTAKISFDVSVDGTTYQHLYDSSGSEVTADVEAGTSYVFELSQAALLMPWRWVKVRSGVAGAFVNQGGARTLTLLGGVL